VQTCIWPSGCHCHSLSLASVKSRLVLPFWYQLTWVVPDKGPLNGCVCVCARNTEAPCSRSTSTKFGKTMQCRSLKCVAVKNYNYKNLSWPTTKYTGVGTFKVRSTSTPAYLNRHIQTRQCSVLEKLGHQRLQRCSSHSPGPTAPSAPSAARLQLSATRYPAQCSIVSLCQLLNLSERHSYFLTHLHTTNRTAASASEVTI